MISQISTNQIVVRVLRNFLGSGENSKAYEDLQKTKDYICYVLKRKDSTEQVKSRSNSAQIESF